MVRHLFYFAILLSAFCHFICCAVFSSTTYWSMLVLPC